MDNHNQIPLLGIEPRVASNYEFEGAKIYKLQPYGFEYFYPMLWFFYNHTLGKILAASVESKSLRILTEMLSHNGNSGMSAVELLPKARRIFSKTKVEELFHIRTPFFNASSPLLRHFCENVATSQALDDVYNALGSFTFGSDRIWPVSFPPDFWSSFHLSVPNGQGVRNRYRLVARLFERLGGGRALSIACGSAQPLIHAAMTMNAQGRVCAELTLTDISEDSLRLASKRAEQAGQASNVSLLKMSYGETVKHCQTNKFDIVEACGILDYLPDAQCVFLISQALNALSPSGHIIVSNMAPTPYAAEQLKRIYNWSIIYRSPEEFTKLLVQAGAKNVEIFVEPWGIHPVAVATK